MISFRSYASGSTGNLYTVSDGKTTIMLDCGLSWKKVQQLLNFKTSEIAAILCGHFHGDHSKGLAHAARAGVDIYASHDTYAALNLTGHRFNDITENQQFTIGTWKILAFKTIHDAEGSLGFYMVNSENEAFLYLTDSGYSPVRFEKLNVIAVECNFVDDILIENVMNGSLPAVVGRRIRRNHMSLQTLIGLLKANDLSQCRHVYLLHLSSGNSDEARMIREVQETVGIPTSAC